MEKGDSGPLPHVLISAHPSQCVQLARLCMAVIQDDTFSLHGGPCFKYHKANGAITELYLYVNVIGNEGAGALAEALKATLATLLASSAHTLILWS